MTDLFPDTINHAANAAKRLTRDRLRVERAEAKAAKKGRKKKATNNPF